MKEYFKFAKKLFFFLLFLALVILSYHINFSQIVGQQKQYFTFFQFIGPICGRFLGIFGVIAVFISQIISYLIIGKEFSFVNIIRLFPMVFAVIYFSKRSFKNLNLEKAVAIIPLLCMILFWLHPIGNKAWFYALYWLIPSIAAFTRLNKNLFFNSLGATFVAHAIGSTIWLYSFDMSAAMWIMLIPIVAIERISFAAGISLSYLIINTFLCKIEVYLPEKFVNINKKYCVV